jgi:hypothetical protein
MRKAIIASGRHVGPRSSWESIERHIDRLNAMMENSAIAPDPEAIRNTVRQVIEAEEKALQGLEQLLRTHVGDEVALEAELEKLQRRRSELEELKENEELVVAALKRAVTLINESDIENLYIYLIAPPSGERWIDVLTKIAKGEPNFSLQVWLSTKEKVEIRDRTAHFSPHWSGVTIVTFKRADVGGAESEAEVGEGVAPAERKEPIYVARIDIGTSVQESFQAVPPPIAMTRRGRGEVEEIDKLEVARLTLLDILRSTVDHLREEGKYEEAAKLERQVEGSKNNVEKLLEVADEWGIRLPKELRDFLEGPEEEPLGGKEPDEESLEFNEEEFDEDERTLRAVLLRKCRELINESRKKQ